MMKLQIPNSKIFIVALIILFIVISYLGRGWLRVTAAPAFATWRYASPLQSDFNASDKQLGYPIRTLGTKTIQSDPTTCSFNYAQTVFTQVGCSVDLTGETDTIDQAYIQKHSTYVEYLQSVLEKNGWHKEQSDNAPARFESLLTEVAPPFPNDYLGYISYVLHTKPGNYCSFEMQRRPQLIVDLSCSRTSNIIFL